MWYRKLHRTLQIILLVSAIFAAWALGLDQLADFLKSGREAQQRQEAIAACVEFKAPHALVVDDKIYCYLSVEGSEYIAPLEALQARKD